MCEMTPGCLVVPGDDISLKPAPHYTDKYNILPKTLHHNLLQAMTRATEEHHSAVSDVIIPDELTAKHMATQYIDFFQEILK